MVVVMMAAVEAALKAVAGTVVVMRVVVGTKVAAGKAEAEAAMGAVTEALVVEAGREGSVQSAAAAWSDR